ncbi:MAG: hypothetical protein U1F16_04430 [Turneriella sp.]
MSPALIYSAEGKITLLSGEVKITHQKKPVKPKLGMLVKEGDTIETGKNAKVAILMSDGASFQLFQHSSLEIKPASTYYESKGVLSANFEKKSSASGSGASKHRLSLRGCAEPPLPLKLRQKIPASYSLKVK